MRIGSERNYKLIIQNRPSNESTNTIFKATTKTIITQVVVSTCNNTDVKFWIYHDDDGTTYDETTALLWKIKAKEKTTLIIDCEWAVEVNGSIGVKVDNSNGLNFTLYGYE